MNKEKIATFAFVGFAVLMAFRDISADLWLSDEKPHMVSFVVCSTIFLLAFFNTLFGSDRSLRSKLRVPGAISRVAALGACSGVIYLGIFYLIHKLGAALAGFIDYGFLPLATALVGWIMFRKRPPIDFLGSFVVFAIGLFLVIMYNRQPEQNRPPFNVFYLIIALIIPTLAAFSDGFTKWLLDEENAGLTRAELLTVRFFPAMIVTYLYCFIESGSAFPIVNNWTITLLVAIVGGWLPLMLLCTGLGRAGMDKLALWEFTIPVFILAATYHKNWGMLSFLPLLGAAMIVGAILVSELHLISRFTQKSGSQL